MVRFDGVSLSYPVSWENREQTLKSTLSKTGLRKKKHGTRTVLDNISLEVKEGERLGVLGINGAGKSTLLRMIARLIPPSTGTLHLGGSSMILNNFNGGFNPEYTGVQNIELTSLLHGRSRKETENHVPGIAEFADIGNQIFEPVKTYSTGMRMRLAFAIAKSLPFDILLVDEVLAVGDGGFQKKCLDWIESIDWTKKAFIFVSHDLEMVNRLTDNCIWISDGGIASSGDTPGMTYYYRKWLYHE